MIEKLKRSRLYKEHLADTEWIAFLKKIKRFLVRLRDKKRNMLKEREHYPHILPILQATIREGEYKNEDWETEDPIDVIVPIYNGYDYLVKLFEDLPKAGLPCRFLLVDDKSTDARVHELEQEFVQKHENALLLHNEENMGFVKTVNHGLREAKGHVALINTDTELPRGWLVRLMKPILTEEKVASTTPYSNSATIFSFPNFCYNNAIYRDLSVDVLDHYFEKVIPQYAAAPTGVGFCMGMNREAIKKVGILDEETYGRGFGEENDWCQRAIKVGYCNVQVENLFVYHKHGGSFVSEEKEKLIADHMTLLRVRYPHYEDDISAFIRKDPNGQLRQIMEMVIDTHELNSILYFDHNLGGGATGYLNLKKEAFLKSGSCVTVVRFDGYTYRWILSFENDRGMQKYEIGDMEELLSVCSYFKFDEIYVNELVSYPHLWQMQEIILQLKKQQNCKLIMLCHDFFALCPTVNLIGIVQSYCGMPKEESCERCYRQKGFDVQYSCDSRRQWVAHWLAFLKGCDEVRAFSQDSLQRMRDTFGDGLAYSLVPHQVDYAFPIHKQTKITDTLNIGLLGVLTVHKGGVMVQELLEEIERQHLNIKITLIGRTEGLDLKKYQNFLQTGAYQVSELPKLIYENDIDLFLVSSVWPETFSYTTEEIMKMGMPIAVLNIGAPAERVKNYEKGLVLGGTDLAITATQMLEQMQLFAEQMGIQKQRVAEKKVLFVAEYISFSSRYRMDHLKEELLYQGITGEVYETKKLPGSVNWDEIAALVIYRCRYMEALPTFMEQAKAHGVPILYDIDDYIFEYDAIRDLPFMANEEYRDFDVYSGLIRQCMEHSDKIIVSTDHMKQVTERSLPGKPVYVNRNVASAQMLILSALAQRKKVKNSKKVILGYYSGSNTHNRDFELISDVLLNFLKTHENAYLKVVGCLELPAAFGCVQDQIIREGFMDWKELPESIAQIDINLMPLENTLFHRCKSENKWMEAALVRVPTVASFNEEISGVTRDGENILLCKDAGEWHENLEKLYDSREYREELAENAFLYVVEHKTTLCKDVKLKQLIMEE